MQHTIPQPPVKPFIGNLPQLDTARPVQSLMDLSRQYGSFFKMRIVNREMLVASSQTLVDELCDETRFKKRVHPVLQEIRAFGGDGLFTAQSDESNWGKAHRVLMPAFGPIGVRGMFDPMLDIADQMFTRWERFGPDAVIDVPDAMTRLTLDTIALCGFDTRFNSFYRDDMHPFVDAMVGGLAEAGNRTRRPAVLSSLMRPTARRFDADVAQMRAVARQLIAERRADPQGAEKDDLLNRMLNGVDPQTGERLSDENIGYQMITFLIAGHETTSGLLSFATYLLLKHPEVMQKARAQVDEVLGDRAPRVEDLTHLRYIEQILMETLRLWPTAPVFAVSPLEPTTLAGQYALTPDDTVMCLLPMLHRDPAVWGDDPEAFRPERFLQENAEKLPPNAWKPFGNGARACIGRPFAMQEAQLVLSVMLQRFDIALDDPDYTLEVHETLTLKPENLRIRARPRHSAPVQQRMRQNTPAPAATPAPVAHTSQPIAEGATPLLVLFGSNTGSSEAFAARIAAEAGAHGFAPQLAPLDDYADTLPTDGALVVVSASYEGQPPDNARQFVPAVEALAPAALDGLAYAVFGCGNRQWARTWQAIPGRIDDALHGAGARRVAERGEGDSGGDFFGAFDSWLADLWPALAGAFGRESASEPATGIVLEFLHGGRASALRLDDLAPGTVVENRELVDMSAPNARSKRHIELRLPEGMTYRAGDYLAVLPRNSAPQVNRALRRFNLAADALVVIESAGSSAGLPVGHPVACSEILASYVELAQPATRAQVAHLAEITRCPPEREALEALAGDAYEAEVLGKRASVLDLLMRFESCPVPFARFLDMLPPLKARQYSISSSPLWKPDHVTLTVAVVDAPAWSGEGRFQGVATSFLAALQPGDRVSIAVRPSNTLFHPPADPSAPMLMICAGSGLAPFRGFLQERALQKAAGQPVGPSLLFFGTNHADVDYLYRDELAAWQDEGVVQVMTAFSEQPEGDIRFVQHRLWAERAQVADLFRQGATVFVCGDGLHMAPAVRETLIKAYIEATGTPDDQAQIWADEMERVHGRYVADVFG